MDSRPHFLEFSTYPLPDLAPAPASKAARRKMELIHWGESPGQLVLTPKNELMLSSTRHNHQSLHLLTSSKLVPPEMEMKMNGTKNLERRCQVEGCNLALAGAKEYHKKHRVCERHSKAGKVVVKGIEQRFCQQCSRFHLVSEFDDAKRSCRRKLARHNKRRRKISLFDGTATSQFGCALSLLSPTKPNSLFSATWVDIEEKPEKQASISSVDPYILFSHKNRSWPCEYDVDKYNIVSDQFLINQAFLEAAAQKTQFQYRPCTNFGS